MVNSVGSTQPQQIESSHPPKPAQPPVHHSSSPQDTVQLSAIAQKALSGSGDVDHDGDSH
jgi:hypothetical protein